MKRKNWFITLIGLASRCRNIKPWEGLLSWFWLRWVCLFQSKNWGRLKRGVGCDFQEGHILTWGPQVFLDAFSWRVLSMSLQAPPHSSFLSVIHCLLATQEYHLDPPGERLGYCADKDSNGTFYGTNWYVSKYHEYSPVDPPLNLGKNSFPSIIIIL